MLKEQYDSVTSEPDKNLIVYNAEDFFTIKESDEQHEDEQNEDEHDEDEHNEDEQNNTELLLDDGEEDMPPLSLEEEVNTDKEEEEDEEENYEDNDENTNYSVYNDEDNEEDDDMDTAPFLCHECRLETVHECGEDRHAWNEEDKDQHVAWPNTRSSEQLTGVQSPADIHRDEIQATINRLEASRTSPQPDARRDQLCRSLQILQIWCQTGRTLLLQ